MAKYVYAAVFTKEENGQYSVVFKDLEGCYTCGDSLEEAIEMAEDVLALTLYGYESEKKKFQTQHLFRILKSIKMNLLIILLVTLWNIEKCIITRQLKKH